MARRARLGRRNQAESPLLSLPPELRNKIYQYVLVHHEPIDLWPHKWVKKDETPSPSVVDPPPSSLKVRHQRDLEHVRKQMSTGLLGTCTQIYREAAMMFWGGNNWRFSGRSGWQGLLRFFLSIGAEARARIRRIDVHAPVYMRWPYKDSDNKDMNGRSKNRPKMHMVQVTGEGHLDRQAIQRVCAMLSLDRSVEEMNFIIPTGFRNGDEDEFGGYDMDHDMEPQSYIRLRRIEELDFIKKTVVVEKGGYLAVNDGPAQIMEKGWDLKCLPGSYIWEKGVEDKGGNIDYEKHEITETRSWSSPARSWDYLEGVSNLFDDSEISIHCGGGRQRVLKLTRARSLTAFGGCRFIEDDGVILPLNGLFEYPNDDITIQLAESTMPSKDSETILGM